MTVDSGTQVSGVDVVLAQYNEIRLDVGSGREHGVREAVSLRLPCVREIQAAERLPVPLRDPVALVPDDDHYLVETQLPKRLETARQERFAAHFDEGFGEFLGSGSEASPLPGSKDDAFHAAVLVGATIEPSLRACRYRGCPLVCATTPGYGGRPEPTGLKRYVAPCETTDR